MFTLTNVSKKFAGEYALRNISLTIGTGLNFIIGASGSGKTTLLKILSGMEQDFDGEACYCGKKLKTLAAKEKSYFYHNIFGFVWQNFNLLEDKTVLENVMISQYLGASQDKKTALKLLHNLKISELAQQKAGKLSGGQKQRVAIARELMKNPRVLLADEPTSALDEKTAKSIMSILRDISKSRTVIIVTHDTTLIDEKAMVYEIDKGELIEAPSQIAGKPQPIIAKRLHRLSVKNACGLAINTIKHKFARTAVTALSVFVAATLLLVTMSGAIVGSSRDTFDSLFDTYGKSILDLSVIASFTGAAGTSGKEEDKQNVDVTQDISGLYEKYSSDERVSHIVFTQAFNDIKITADGTKYEITSSGSAPSVNELIAGDMPMGNDKEVVVAQSFVEKLGITAEEALGKTIDFNATIYNWDSKEPVAVPVSSTAKIVGVVDTTVKYEYGGEISEYSVDDSFFFSKPALEEMKKQAKTENSAANFTIRTKTPADLIAIKDELNASGIVPLGRFELVEDMVRLQNTTTEQSGSAVIVIAILAVVVLISVALITAVSRKREYGVYKISGYSSGNLALLTVCETIICASAAAITFIVTSPVLNLATKAIWNVNILSGKLLLSGVALVVITAALSGITAVFIAASTKTERVLMTGEN